MSTQDPRPFIEARVREYPLPGNRRLLSLMLPNGHTVTVASEPDKAALDLSVTQAGQDAALVTVRMSDVEATTLAALLSGIRLISASVSDPEDDETDLRTVRLPLGSAAVGRRLHELELPAPDLARVIGVIRDDTPELLEEDPDRPCQPGDRLVLVGRPTAMGDLVSALTTER